ncbi:hypothetical protein LNQ03_20785 [Klebsiella pneumoniae subsp. pneumoniae]|nr:hypothetical protein [Klebsiella pneumoniae subsp. pneumoniae]
MRSTFAPSWPQQLHGGIDVFQLRYVLDLYRLFGKQRGKRIGRAAFFAPEMVSFTLKAVGP